MEKEPLDGSEHFPPPAGKHTDPDREEHQKQGEPKQRQFQIGFDDIPPALQCQQIGCEGNAQRKDGNHTSPEETGMGLPGRFPLPDRYGNQRGAHGGEGEDRHEQLKFQKLRRYLIDEKIGQQHQGYQDKAGLDDPQRDEPAPFDKQGENRCKNRQQEEHGKNQDFDDPHTITSPVQNGLNGL